MQKRHSRRPRGTLINAPRPAVLRGRPPLPAHQVSRSYQVGLAYRSPVGGAETAIHGPVGPVILGGVAGLASRGGRSGGRDADPRYLAVAAAMASVSAVASESASVTVA